MSARHPIVLPSAPAAGRPVQAAVSGTCTMIPVRCRVISIPSRPLTRLVMMPKSHLARLVLFEGELWNPVQPSPDLGQVKHRPLR